MDIQKDYYAALGLLPDASAVQIKHAYRKKALTFHPDRGGSHYHMRELNEAWAVLGDPAQRREYDSLRVRSSGVPLVTPVPARPRDRTSSPRVQPRESRLVKAGGSMAMRVAFFLGRIVGGLFHLVVGGRTQRRARRPAVRKMQKPRRHA